MGPKKDMEPKKANRAIILTAVIALLLELICAGFLFDWFQFPVKQVQGSSSQTNVSIDLTLPTATPKARPSANDLKGCSDKLVFPKESSYLASYETYSVKPEVGQKSYLLFKPEKLQFTSDRIMDLEKDTVVTAIAKENGYTMVKVQDGVAGWLPTQELQSH